MTDTVSVKGVFKKNNTRRRVTNAVFNISLVLIAFSVSLFFSDEIAHSVKSGLSLCANVIIPSVFPFIVISDFLYSTMDFSSLKFIDGVFRRVFKISAEGLYAFVLGILCGFPLGVKCVRDLYLSGNITKDESERLIGFCNNTGPAFLVCGIGLGLRGNITEGIILYVAMVISAIICGIVLSIGAKSETGTESIRQAPPFSFTLSIKNAGINTLNICSYLTFFACACGILRKLLGECYLYIGILPFLEIGSSTSILSKTSLLNKFQSLALSGFAVGFSGLSVHLQALSFLIDTDISAKRYFISKLLQGILCMLISSLLYLTLI